MTEFFVEGLLGAVLSPCKKHRYWLWRKWRSDRPLLVTCMFNPSTADARKDDPTISRLCGFAQRWGYGGILVFNLFSLRTPDPSLVRGCEREAFGDAQPEAIAAALTLAEQQGTPVLIAWGTLPSMWDKRPVLDAAAGLDLICLGLSKDGAPKHPMARGKSRVPDDQQPVPFEPY
jgi:hypothetical protein